MYNTWLLLSFGGDDDDENDDHVHDDHHDDNDDDVNDDDDDDAVLAIGLNLREEVLPLLLNIGSPKSSFPIYSVVFHEV